MTDTACDVPVTVTGPPEATLVLPWVSVTERRPPWQAAAMPPTVTDVTLPPEVVKEEAANPSGSQAVTAADPPPTLIVPVGIVAAEACTDMTSPVAPRAAAIASLFMFYGPTIVTCTPVTSAAGTPEVVKLIE